MKPELQPGDCLLYSPAPKSVFGWLIAIKTWHAVSHCEVYIGEGMSVASRDGKGVDSYPVRWDNLSIIMRPKGEYKFNLQAALKWFITEAKGQKYDWVGLLRFSWRSDFVKGGENNKQFCSEFATRFYRAGGLDPFNGEDADAVPPYLFSISPVFSRVPLKEA